MDANGERWLPVPNCAGYEVSDRGRVRCWRPFHGEKVLAPRLLSPTTGKRGYPVVVVGTAGKRRPTVVHRLVMSAFVGPRPDGMETRHLNGEKLDNRLANLAYGTSAENTGDMLRQGHQVSGRGTHKIRHKVRTACFSGHPYDEANTLYPPSGGRQCRTCTRLRMRKRRALRRHEVTLVTDNS